MQKQEDEQRRNDPDDLTEADLRDLPYEDLNGDDWDEDPDEWARDRRDSGLRRHRPQRREADPEWEQ